MTTGIERDRASLASVMGPIPGKPSVQYAYHKCLTLYFERVFVRLCFFEMPFWARLRGQDFVRKFSASQRAPKSRHLRDPSFGQ
jgi:hypothetical protein